MQRSAGTRQVRRHLRALKLDYVLTLYVCFFSCVCQTIPKTLYSHIVCEGCQQHICHQCAVQTGAPSASTWNCKLCNSFLKGSHTACDWLLQQLNERFAASRLDATNGEPGRDVVDTVDGDTVAEKSIEWNQKGERWMIKGIVMLQNMLVIMQ